MSNKYQRLDIVRQAALDQSGIMLLNACYDPFFKQASGLDLADMAEGHVESPLGWFALIDISDDEKHSALLKAMDLTYIDDDEIPGKGFYVTTEESTGVIWCYEYPTLAAARAAYDSMASSYDDWYNASEDGDN